MTTSPARLLSPKAAALILAALMNCPGDAVDNTPAAIVLSPATASVEAGKTVTISATVNNASGSPVTGATVSFASSNTNVAAVTSAGVVTGALAGTATITASVGSVTGTASITVKAGAASAAAKSADLPAAPVVGSSNTISVKVTDAGGNLVSGATVAFAATAGGGSITPASGTTDANGIATASFKMGAVAGTNTATATVTGVTPVAFTATSVAGSASAITKSSTDPTSAVVSSSTTISAKVTDAGGNPVAGTTVTFAVTAGGGSVSPASATTNSSGIATSSFTMGNLVGTNTATASMSGVATPVTFTTITTPGTASSITKSGTDPTAPVVASSNNVSVKVTDAAGNVVPGQSVTFAVTAGGGTVTPASATTDSLGVATASFKVGSTVGTNTATASLTGVTTPVTFTLATVAGPISTLTKVGTDPTSVIAGDKFGTEVRVRARDSFGNVISNATITFAVTAGGGSVATASVKTGTDGDAATVFTTGKTVGANTATASVSGVSSAVSFSVTTVAGAPVKVGAPSTGIVLAIPSGAVPLGFTLKDANDNPTTGGTFTYTSRSTSIATVSSNGTVTAVAAGQVVIVASASQGSDSMIVVVRGADGTPVLMTDIVSFGVTAGSNLTFRVQTDMTGNADKLGSTSVKVEWDPALFTYQSNAAVAGGPTPTVLTTSASTGSLTFSIADATGYSGRVNLIQVTLKAVAAAGATGTIKLTASEVNAAVTFANLLPATLAVTMPIIIR
jgi:adhesin/invasin